MTDDTPLSTSLSEDERQRLNSALDFPVENYDDLERVAVVEPRISTDDSPDYVVAFYLDPTVEDPTPPRIDQAVISLDDRTVVLPTDVRLDSA